MIDLIQLRKEAQDAYDWDEHRDVCVPAKDVLAILDVVEAAQEVNAVYWDFDRSMKTEAEALRDALLRLDGKEGKT